CPSTLYAMLRDLVIHLGHKKREYRAVETVVEFLATETRRIGADYGRHLCKRSAARREKNEMIHARHHVLLGPLRQLFAHHLGIPSIRRLVVIEGTPQLDGNRDLLQPAIRKKKHTRGPS